MEDKATQDDDSTPTPVKFSDVHKSRDRKLNNYSKEEDEKILKYIVKEDDKISKYILKRATLWVWMEKEGVVNGKSWVSIQRRFLKVLVKRLEEFSWLSKTTIEKLRRGAEKRN